MACGDKRKSRCGDKIQAVCVSYEGEKPERLTDDCYNIEEIIEDIYSDLDSIKKNISTEGLGESCIQYKTPNTLTVLDVLKKHEEKICSLSNASGNEGLNNVDIQDWGLDTSCLATICEKPNIATLKDLLQSMINKICDLETQITSLSVNSKTDTDLNLIA